MEASELEKLADVIRGTFPGKNVAYLGLLTKRGESYPIKFNPLDRPTPTEERHYTFEIDLDDAASKRVISAMRAPYSPFMEKISSQGPCEVYSPLPYAFTLNGKFMLSVPEEYLATSTRNLEANAASITSLLQIERKMPQKNDGIRSL